MPPRELGLVRAASEARGEWWWKVLPPPATEGEGEGEEEEEEPG